MIVQARSVYDEQTDHTFRPAKEFLPTMYDLPSENPEEPGVPDQFHIWQPDLLTQTFCPPEYTPKQMLIASDLNLYYDIHNSDNYKRPDWYAVLGVPHLYDGRDPRLSYLIWQEEVVPFIAVELLSPGTRKEDLGKTRRKSGKPPTKWQVYEKILGIPYYIVFSRYTDELFAFELIRGRYRKIPLPEKRVWLPEIKLGLGLWRGTYKYLERKWLRWYDAEGNWIPTSVEKEKQRAEKEKQRAEKEKQRAEKEKQRAETAEQRAETAEQRAESAEQHTERLLAQLKALGIKPDSERK